jgi:signal recognition particle subunit SRP54
MTIEERRNPSLIRRNPNRRIRIIKGSGRKPDDLNKLLSK